MALSSVILNCVEFYYILLTNTCSEGLADFCVELTSAPTCTQLILESGQYPARSVDQQCEGHLSSISDQRSGSRTIVWISGRSYILVGCLQFEQFHSQFSLMAAVKRKITNRSECVIMFFCGSSLHVLAISVVFCDTKLHLSLRTAVKLISIISFLLRMQLFCWNKH